MRRTRGNDGARELLWSALAPSAANDNGLDFRYSEPNWVYNLSTQGLGPGTYTITIRIPDGRNFNAGFVLR